MDLNAAVYRTEATLKQALDDCGCSRSATPGSPIQDKGQRYNTDLLEAVELGSCWNWPRCSWSARWSAPNPAAATPGRTTRTGTTPTGCGTPWPTSRAWSCTADIRLDYKPVVQTRYQPMERKY